MKKYWKDCEYYKKSGYLENPDKPWEDPFEAKLVQEYQLGYVRGAREVRKLIYEKEIKSLPKREWVGLTDEELDAIYEQHHNQYAECISPNFGYELAIEAKLKEKNT